MSKNYIEPTQEAGAKFFSRQIGGEVIMLNLLNFKDIADYSDHPELDDGKKITGKEAYQKYMNQTLPLLKEKGGEIIFSGEGGNYLIGPPNKTWDLVLLIKQQSLSNLMAMANDKKYKSILGHRDAALEDSRLLPLIENTIT